MPVPKGTVVLQGQPEHSITGSPSHFDGHVDEPVIVTLPVEQEACLPLTALGAGVNVVGVTSGVCVPSSG